MAVVLHATGAVQVTPATGAAFAASPGQDLVGSDTVTPAEGAFAVLGLDNGHLVRVDDVGALRVDQILLLGAGPTTRTRADQLAALLDAGEAVPAKDVEERAAAWIQMRRAGETAGRGDMSELKKSSDEADMRSREGVSMPAPEEAAGNGPARPGKVQRQKDAQTGRKENSAPAPIVAVAPSPLQDAVVAAPPAAQPPAAQAPGAPPKEPSTTPAPMEPGLVASAGPKPTATTPLDSVPFLGGGVAVCLEDAMRTHGVARSDVVLFLEIKSGVVTRARLGGALPPGDCVKSLVGRPAAAAGWLVLRLAP